MALIINEVSFVLFAIRPNKLTPTIHFVLNPFSSVLLAVRPDVVPHSFDQVLSKVANIDRSICKNQFSKPVLSAITILSLIVGTIRPCLNTMSVLIVVLPLADVFLPTNVNKYPLTICNVVFPLSLIDVSICMYKLSLAANHSVFPVAFIHGAVFPSLFSVTLFHSIFPMSFVDCAIFLFDLFVDAFMI